MNFHSNVEIRDLGSLQTRDEQAEHLVVFSSVPEAYLELYRQYGAATLVFRGESGHVTYDIKHPIEAAEFYHLFLDDGRIPADLFPFAAGMGATTLYAGELKGKNGVYFCFDSYLGREEMEFVSSSLPALLMRGEGIERLIELER